MAERFRIGEIAILVLTPGDELLDYWAPYVGQEVEVVDGLRKRRCTNGETIPVYVVQSSDGQRFGAMPCNLRKKRPPPLREPLGEWDLCPWQPVTHAVSKDP